MRARNSVKSSVVLCFINHSVAFNIIKSMLEKNGNFCMLPVTTNVQISLRICAGWSAPLLIAVYTVFYSYTCSVQIFKVPADQIGGIYYMYQVVNFLMK